MSDHWLYSQQLPAGAADWTLEGDEAQHGRAKHLEAGEAIHLFDGRGRVAAARVVECGKRALVVRVETVEMVRPRLPRVTIAVSQPKGERLDWMLEKLTELGVAGIWPVQCERSVAHAKEDRLDRWQRRLIEAGKQAHVAWLPELAGSQRLAQVVARAGEFGRAMVADMGTRPVTSSGTPTSRSGPCHEVRSVSREEGVAPSNDHGPATAQGHGTRATEAPPSTRLLGVAHKEALADNLPVAPGGMAANNAPMAPGPILAGKFASGDRLLVVIGPEGGFSDQEREAMRRGGFVSVSLGSTVLRTETAAIVAAGCLLAAGDLAGLPHGGAV